MKFARFLESRSAATSDSQPDLAPPFPAPQNDAPRTGVQIAFLHDGTNMSAAGLIEAGLLEAISGSSVALLVQPLLPGASAAILQRFLADHRPAAIVIAPPLSYDEALAHLCADAGVTALRLGPTEGDFTVGCDERAAMAALVADLIARGHTRIALISGADHSPSARLREMGYLDMLAEHGLDRGPSLIVPGDDSFTAGQEAARLLFQVSPLPSAILATCDMMAAGVLAAAAEARIAVPAGLAVAGFDDMPIAARLAPALTSVQIPWRTMARDAVRRLFASHLSPQPTVYPAPIIERASTTMPKADLSRSALDPERR